MKKNENNTAGVYVGLGSEVMNGLPGSVGVLGDIQVFPLTLEGGVDDEVKDSLVSWNFINGDNAFPTKAIEILYSDKDVPAVLETIVNFIIGNNDIAFFRYNMGEKERVFYPEIEAWKRANRLKLQRFIRSLATQYVYFDNYFAQFATDAQGRVTDFGAIDPAYFRLGSSIDEATGKSEYGYINKNLGIGGQQYMSFRWERMRAWGVAGQPKSNLFYHGGGYTPTQLYYSVPSWVGGIDNLTLRKKIMQLYNNTLDNGFNIKFVIEIHPAYYSNIGATTKEQKDAAKSDLSQKIEDFFKGTTAGGRSILVDKLVDNITRSYEGLITIKPVDNQLSDTQFAELLKQTDGNTPVNFGLDATLAGFTKQGMGASGSDTLYKYLFHTAVKVPSQRMAVLEPVWLILESLGFVARYDFTEIGFVDAKIVRQSDSHTGIDSSVI